MPEGCSAFDQYVTRDNILTTCLALDMADYVDWGSGTVRFDSPEFIRLLNFANSFPTEFDWENYDWSREESTEERLSQGKQMLVQTSAYSVEDIFYNNYAPFMGGKVTYIGYLTANGTVIPASPHYTPHLIIASGNYDLATGVGFDETLAIAKAIGKDQRYTDHIGQIYRNNDNEYELIVNNLPIQVLIGDTCDIDSKLHRLETLLEKYHGTEELTGYKTMSLKYKNQIVCTKK